MICENVRLNCWYEIQKKSYGEVGDTKLGLVGL
jgi:hypothetical protein